MKISLRIWGFLWILLFWTHAGAQNNKAALEQKRREITRQIHQINRLLRDTRATEKNTLARYRLLEQKIAYQQKLIDNLRRELRQIDNRIRIKEDSLSMLNDEYRQLREAYARAVRNIYKMSSKEKILFYVLSADNFQQAYRRIRYLREYADFLKRQARDIEQKKAEIEAVKQRLTAQKHRKQNTLTRLNDEKRQLERDRRAQQQILAQLRKKKSYYIAQIRKKQREARRIDREIRKIIEREIARRNKASGKKGRKEFSLTPEGRALARSFASNKGRLPWPVKHGYVSRKFGVQWHPVFKNVKITSSGIHITTPPEEKVYSIFDGEVMMIQVIPGANTSVYVRHGNYITIYGNLENIKVRNGQKVKKGQLLGTVGKDPSTGTYILKFKIFKNLQKLNPLQWLARK